MDVRPDRFARALLGLVTCVLVAGCTGTSENPAPSPSPTASATVALKVGDCLDTSPVTWEESEGQTTADAQLDPLPAVPCEQPHGGQVILVDEDFWAGADQIPSDAELNAQAGPPCSAAVPAVTGGPLAPPYAVFFMGPQPSTWPEDRRLVCVLMEMDADGKPVPRTAPITPA